MTLLLAMRGTIATRSMSGPPFALQRHRTTVWCRAITPNAVAVLVHLFNWTDCSAMGCKGFPQGGRHEAVPGSGGLCVLATPARARHHEDLPRCPREDPQRAARPRMASGSPLLTPLCSGKVGTC